MGDVYEYNLETKKYKPLTHHYHHAGYFRALYLSNGDILLSGATDAPNSDWREARFRKAELWVLGKELKKPPVRLGEYCWEGPTASRTQLRIAWANHHGIYPKQKRYYEIFVADIDYSSGEPRIANQRRVLDNNHEAVKGKTLETQNFRPGKEHEIIFQLSGGLCETMGLDINTGEVVNYSNDPSSYNEAEGIFPDGKYTLVECSRHAGKRSVMDIDLWKLELTLDNPSWERLTRFNDTGVYKASNPVVSDDGTMIAFQVAARGAAPGVGHGIYILDLIKRKEALK